MKLLELQRREWAEEEKGNTPSSSAAGSQAALSRHNPVLPALESPLRPCPRARSSGEQEPVFRGTAG